MRSSLASGNRLSSGPWWERWLTERSAFTFHDRWRTPGTVEQISALLLDTHALPDWWPQLRRVWVTDAGAGDGAQRSFSARVKGFLPYELQLGFRVVQVQYPRQFAVELLGDLQGIGGGNLRQEGDNVAIDLSLQVSVARPLLKVLSIVGRPMLRAQHQWVMRQGELGLHRELARQRAQVGASPR